jgi:hypothetical protein
MAVRDTSNQRSDRGFEQLSLQRLCKVSETSWMFVDIIGKEKSGIVMVMAVRWIIYKDREGEGGIGTRDNKPFSRKKTNKGDRKNETYHPTLTTFVFNTLIRATPNSHLQWKVEI